MTFSKLIELPVSTNSLHFCPFVTISVFGGALFTSLTVIPKEMSVSEFSDCSVSFSESVHVYVCRSTCFTRLCQFWCMYFFFFLKQTDTKWFLFLKELSFCRTGSILVWKITTTVVTFYTFILRNT